MSKTNQKVQIKEVESTTFDSESYIKECGSVSAAIRKLDSEGKTRSQISKMLNKRYQHVRNVLITPLKKN